MLDTTYNHVWTLFDETTERGLIFAQPWLALLDVVIALIIRGRTRAGSGPCVSPFCVRIFSSICSDENDGKLRPSLIHYSLSPHFRYSGQSLVQPRAVKKMNHTWCRICTL